MKKADLHDARPIFRMGDTCHQDIVPEMCVGGAPVHLPPFGPGKETGIAAAANMEPVDIGMDPFCEGSAQGNDAAPAIFCVPDGDCPQWVVKISYPEIQCLGKPAACAAEEPEQPYLTAYLGHQDFRATQYYLRLTAEIYPELVRVMEAACWDVIPGGGGNEES